MKHLFFLLLLVTTLQITAQENRQYEKYIHPNDSLLMINLPELTLPDSYKGPTAKDLPDYHDNSVQPYFRPIFNQWGWSCGQASTVGYNFTYEINRKQNSPAANLDNQFTPLFTFNFFNKGADATGVCYLYSLNAIKKAGNPNAVDYGGMGESITMWPTGYDTYYNSMFNRIDDIYTLHVGDAEGLQTLKYWIYDHLEGSPYGGLANFYTDLYDVTTLPPGTPEEGKSVITAFGTYQGHSMTFIGWNDSIRWDYNNDGQYTNDIDINGDGEVTMKDWEIGGVILANSWGDGWADSGFCYVMYNVLAMEKAEGGIWNKQVNVFTVKEDYEPQLTYKIKLKHNSRNKIKISAGVSRDTSDAAPVYTFDFPIFNYQGGDNYMQGDNSAEEFKTLEFGLDITPLLSYINSGEPAKFFIQVHENDPDNYSTGTLNQFSLIDYISGGVEIACQETDVPLNENSNTTLSVIHTLSFDKIQITDEELPAFTNGQSYEYQMSASGGDDPYSWDVSPVYFKSEFEDIYPDIQGQQLNTNGNQSGFVSLPIEFPFPFYDKLYDTITLHVDGFLMFKEMPYPLPYQVDDMLLFEYEPMVAAFLNKNIYINNGNADKIWYEGDETYAAFRWDVTLEIGTNDYPLDFTTILYPDGNIEIFCDELNIAVTESNRITGISGGDGNNLELAETTQVVPAESSQVATFFPQNYPSETTITEDGLLSFIPGDENKIYTLGLKVTDDFNIFDQKSLQLSNGLIYDYSILSGNDNQIDIGETAHLDFTLTNTGSEPLTNVILSIENNDPYIIILDDTELAGTINPGMSVDLIDAVSFEVETIIPDNYTFTLNIYFTSDENNWESRINLNVYAPLISLGTPIVDDGDNNRLDPGETTDIIIPVINTGHSLAEQVEGFVNSFDPYITMNTPGQLNFGNIPDGGIVYDTFNLTVHEDTPPGHLMYFMISITALPDYSFEDSFSLLVGRYPVFVADLDPELLSGPFIKTALEQLDILHDYDYVLPNNLDVFQNIFITLGRTFGQHVLTETEGNALANFLEGGGNIYMEGGLTWYDDPQTAVHPMFNIIPEYTGWNQIESVYGTEWNFADSLKFLYQGDELYYNYHLQPNGLSFPLLYNSDNGHNLAITYAGVNYKTIGSIIDFGGLTDGFIPSTKYHLMARILEFFDVDVVITEVNNYNLADNLHEISVVPNPVSDKLSIYFTLEKAEQLSVRISDINGKLILSPVSNKQYLSGSHEINCDVSKFQPGIYICTLKSNSTIRSIKVIKTAKIGKN